VEWQQEMQDPSDFLSTLKIDLYPEEVYAFTPKGKVIILPRDASPVDFAYAIHSEVGNKCIGAKVNGRIVPLKSRLKNGDIVEIQTRLGILERDWLSFVKTSRARNKIRTTSMSFKENAQSRSERRSWKRKHENSKSI
jgi:GTP pyrophosphokinase